MKFSECVNEPIWPYCAVVAWFVQMGVHEGFHAFASYRLGDPTADFLGKRTINPSAHIEWNNPFSWLVTVIVPVLSVFHFGMLVPIGMAWVPVNIYNFRRPLRDFALVALAGPLGNIVVCTVAITLHFAVLRWLPESGPSRAIETLFCSIYLTSLAYGLFNLFPLPPLDGSRVVYWLAPDPVRKVYDLIQPYGFFLVLILFRIVPPLSIGFWFLIALGAFAWR